MQHPEEGIIHAWLDGGLPANEASAIESHVRSCVECGARVAEARGLIAASSRIIGHLDAVPANVIPSKPSRRRLSWRNPWLEGVIAAGFIAGIWFYSGYAPTFGRGQKADAVSQAPERMRPVVANDTAAVAPPSTAAPLAQTQLADRRTNRRTAEEPTPPSLPPANAAIQKATTPAPQPSAPPVTSKRFETNRAEAQAAETRVATADAARAPNRSAAGAAVGSVAGAAARTSAPAPAMVFQPQSETALTAQAFAGCYEMNASTEVLPARFALRPDSSAISGLMSIYYVDAEGRAASRIADLGWTMEAGQVIVKTLARETLLTLRKTGSAVAGEGRSGSRSGRVISCTR